MTKNYVLLAGLEPAVLWQHFATLSEIPHGSGDEAKLAEFILALAVGKNFYSYRDEGGNVFVRIPATEGYENYPSLCLQSHIDMVLAKEEYVAEIFPLNLRIEGDKLMATDTTLGADNGIGVAAMMAIITESTISHGPLELLFTVAEETGMKGAEVFDFSELESQFIINLDSEEENVIFVGCAGGIQVQGEFSGVMERLSRTSAYDCKMAISLTGLSGGHSGLKIREGKANAIKIMAQLLEAIDGDKFAIISFDGGDFVNQIPVKSQVVVVLLDEDREEIMASMKEKLTFIATDFPKESLQLTFSSLPFVDDDYLVGDDYQDPLLAAILALPDGILSMEPLDNNILRSSNNVVVIKTEDSSIKIDCLLRSSSTAQMEYIQKMIESAFYLAYAGTNILMNFPPWVPKFDSKLLTLVKQMSLEVFGVEAKVESIHAGLECSKIDSALPKAEKLSFGPQMGLVHTSSEWVSIPSVAKFWQLLLLILESGGVVQEKTE